MVKVWTAASTRSGVPSQGEGMQCSLEGGTASLASSQSMSVCRWHQEGGGRGWGVGGGEGGEGRRAWRRELKDMSRRGRPTGHKWV